MWHRYIARKNLGQATPCRRPCSSLLNLPGISWISSLSTCELQITGRLAGLRRSSQSSYLQPSISFFFSSSSSSSFFSFSSSHKQSCVSMTDMPWQKWEDTRYRIIKNSSIASIGLFLSHAKLHRISPHYIRFIIYVYSVSRNYNLIRKMHIATWDE